MTLIRLSAILLFLFLIAGCSMPYFLRQRPTTEKMAYIPEGNYMMGSSEKDGKIGVTVGVDELPQHKVYLKGFYIDRYEITIGEFYRFIVSTGYKPPRIMVEEEWILIYPLPEDNHPMKGVSWYDADAYCRWAGKRLPTEEEWEKAARGTDGRIWPWGNEPNSVQKIIANTTEAGAYWTVPVGSYPEGVSPYGVHDMSGNVMEWTASWYNAYPGSDLKREAFGEINKVLRGGSWENPTTPIGRSAYRHPVKPVWDHPAHGFRCAMDE